VRIRPDDAALVDTYISPDQLAQVRIGAPADISFDSGGGKTVPATVAIIGNTVAYPPSSFPTSIVHMTRTFDGHPSARLRRCAPRGHAGRHSDPHELEPPGHAARLAQAEQER